MGCLDNNNDDSSLISNCLSGTKTCLRAKCELLSWLSFTCFADLHVTQSFRIHFWAEEAGILFVHTLWICNALAYTGCFFSLGLSLFSNQKTSQQSYQRFSKIENFTKHKGWLPKSYIIFDTENKNTLFFWGTLDNNLTVTRKMSLICFVLVVLLFMMMIVMGMTLTVRLHEG